MKRKKNIKNKNITRRAVVRVKTGVKAGAYLVEMVYQAQDITQLNRMMGRGQLGNIRSIREL